VIRVGALDREKLDRDGAGTAILASILEVSVEVRDWLAVALIDFGWHGPRAKKPGLIARGST
jgi:hypothetical protein